MVIEAEDTSTGTAALRSTARAQPSTNPARLHHHPYRRCRHRCTAGGPADAARRTKEMSRRHQALRKSRLGEGETLPAKDENDRGSNAGERAVGAEGDLGGPCGHRGLYDPVYHTTAATAPPPRSLPLRRTLCSPGIELSRRSRLSREGSACGGEGAGLRYRSRGAQCWRPEVKDGAYPAGGDLAGGEVTGGRERR